MKYLLINPKAHNGKSRENLKQLEETFGTVITQSIIGLDLDEFFKHIKKDDEVVIIGGDGTLNHFVNDIGDKKLPCPFYMFAAGTGNDFKNDMKAYIHNDLILLNDVITHLPVATIKGKKYKFINGIGYGLDGYCCEEGDRLQAISDKPVNYTSIAIKGLLFKFKPSNATVTVDGVPHKYKKVWLAPTMLGKFYGGGMMIAPMQDRFNEESTVTTCVLHDSGKLSSLVKFPKIFKGEHVKFTDIFDFYSAHHVKVEFDRPQALQVDGETISNVYSYEVEFDKIEK